MPLATSSTLIASEFDALVISIMDIAISSLLAILTLFTRNMTQKTIAHIYDEVPKLFRVVYS